MGRPKWYWISARVKDCNSKFGSRTENIANAEYNDQTDIVARFSLIEEIIAVEHWERFKTRQRTIKQPWDALLKSNIKVTIVKIDSVNAPVIKDKINSSSVSSLPLLMNRAVRKPEEIKINCVKQINPNINEIFCAVSIIDWERPLPLLITCSRLRYTDTIFAILLSRHTRKMIQYISSPTDFKYEMTPV